ncbi:MAG TPA: substrate-binding domain-containing protein [Vicinamibacterales bacterium]|jgi:ABC-type phosphate transport system substrate-binding protein|nr:substrate-binding domain-containing protein [Vicinamibacterales bacterium]
MKSRLNLLAVIIVATFAGGNPAWSGAIQARTSVPTTVAAHDTLVIIVNKDNPVAELSVFDLRRMLLGETTRWPDGRKVTIAMREPGQPERDALLRVMCRMTESDFTRYLLHAAFRGDPQGTLKQLDTPNGVRRFVFNVPGAIGYVRGDEMDDSVKVLKIAGPIPETPIYGLTLRAR